MSTLLNEQAVIDQLQLRHNSLRKWLTEHAPDCGQEQAHLDSGTSERVYWHYGYAVALRDALALLEGGASARKH